MGLPLDSATARVEVQSWGNSDELLAVVVEAIQHLTAVTVAAAGGDPPQIARVPRPWDKDEDKPEPLSRESFRAMFAAAGEVLG